MRRPVTVRFIVVFYCYAARLAVEADGAAHASQVAYDTVLEDGEGRCV